MAKRRRLDTYTDETPRERAERAIAQSMELREHAYAAMLTPEGWDAFLRARVLHPRYSWRNCALIAYQRPEAYAVATFAQWRAAGYVVRKGEHSTIRIARGMRGTCSLFEIGQTDCPPPETEDDLLPDGYHDQLATMRERSPAPRSLAELPQCGEQAHHVYSALTGAQEVTACTRT